MTFWERIQILCSEKNTTPTGLCKSLGLSTSMATRWKNGTIPNPATMEILAEALGVTSRFLMWGSDSASSPADEAMAKLTASMQEALDSMEKEKSPLLRSLENLVKNMTQDQQREMKKYAEYLINSNNKD